MTNSVVTEPKRNLRVVVTRGIPGSGKTTWARAEIQKQPDGTAVRISNDEMSQTASARDPENPLFSPERGKILRDMRLALLEVYLKSDFINTIYIENTNLVVRTVRELEKVTLLHGAEFIVNDDFLDVDIEECIRRDLLRPNPVGENIIIKMSKLAVKLKPWVYVDAPKLEVVDNVSKKDYCILVDLDGTLAHMTGRGPYDWARVGEDSVDRNVDSLIDSYIFLGVTVVIMSGRDGVSMPETLAWLAKNNVSYDEIYMRAEGDKRQDWVVKHELYQNHIADNYNVLFALDDRNQVVKMWRKIGLPTWQVAEGDF